MHGFIKRTGSAIHLSVDKEIMAKMSLLAISLVRSAVALLALSSLTREQEVTFVVKPANQRVAVHTEARFDCVLTSAGIATNLHWEINRVQLQINRMPPANSRYNAKWHTELNSTLYFNASMNDNGTTIACIASIMGSHHYRRAAYLWIAGPPLKPADFVAKYNRTQHMISLHWQYPFTYSQTFPILEYFANMYCSHTNRKLLQPISIEGNKTSHSLYLNESDLCTCDNVYVNLTAQNSIGESLQAQAFVRTSQEYEPFPINTSLSLQPDGRTLVSVVFPRPACFPQGMQPSIMVEEVPSLSDGVSHISLYDGNDDTMESFTLTAMKPDAMYSVTVYLKSETRNVSSLPMIVSLSDADAHSMKGNDNGMVLIIAASIGAFLVCGTTIGVTICVIAIISLRRRGKKEKYSISIQMQSNPIYEGPLYETISELSVPLSSAPISMTTLNECHIIKGIPNGSVPQLCTTEELANCSDSSNGNIHRNEYMTHTHGMEEDYMVMHPVSDSPVQVQVDV